MATVTTTLTLADQHHCQELKEACLAFMSSPKVVQVVVASDEFKHLMASCPQLVSDNRRLFDNALAETAKNRLRFSIDG